MNRFKRIRKEIQADFHCTRDQFLASIGCARSTWHRYETGESPIPWEVCERIVKLYGRRYLDEMMADDPPDETGEEGPSHE